MSSAATLKYIVALTGQDPETCVLTTSKFLSPPAEYTLH